VGGRRQVEDWAWERTVVQHWATYETRQTLSHGGRTSKTTLYILCGAPTRITGAHHTRDACRKAYRRLSRHRFAPHYQLGER